MAAIADRYSNLYFRDNLSETVANEALKQHITTIIVQFAQTGYGNTSDPGKSHIPQIDI